MATIHSINRKPAAAAAGSPPEPPSRSHPQYKMFAAKVREYRALGSKYEVEAMYTLMDFERATISWKTAPTMKFEEVIREERFFPVAKWLAFKKAIEIGGKSKDLTKEQIKRLGVSAINLIMRQPAAYHKKLIKRAIAYRNEHEVEPTYQYVSRLIRTTIKTTAKDAGPTKRQLQAYVDKLKEQIKGLGAKPVLMDKE